MKVNKIMDTSSKQSWHVILLDTGDGSGDAFLPLQMT